MADSKNKKCNEQNAQEHKKESSKPKRITNKQRAKHDNMRQIDWACFGPFYWD